MSAMCRCGASWTGHRIEHCTECHQTFTGTSSGDKHRVGDYALTAGPDRRRCLTADEMRGKGMAQNARGQWTNGGTSPWSTQPTTGAEGSCLDCGARPDGHHGFHESRCGRAACHCPDPCIEPST